MFLDYIELHLGFSVFLRFSIERIELFQVGFVDFYFSEFVFR